MTSSPLTVPYQRGRRTSFLEDVKVEQDLGWGASVVDMLNAKQVGLPSSPDIPPLQVLTHQWTNHETEPKLEANSETPKLSHEADDSENDVFSTHLE